MKNLIKKYLHLEKPNFFLLKTTFFIICSSNRKDLKIIDKTINWQKKSMDDIRQKLIEIKETGSFDQLGPLFESSTLEKMGSDERFLLSELLNLQGDKELAEGKAKCVHTFKKAAEIVNHSPSILFKQAMIFAKYSENFSCLNAAHQIFIQVLGKEPEWVEALYADTLVILRMGVFDGDPGYFFEANEQFKKIASLLPKRHEEFNLGEFYWKWARCLTIIARVAGEPHDFSQAIEKFQLAAENGINEAVFYNDYGDAYAELGNLLENRDHFITALIYFEKALEAGTDNFRSFYNKATCLEKLYDFSPSIDLYHQANQCFQEASAINDNHPYLWYKWAQLVIDHAKFSRDLSQLEDGLEKIKTASFLDPEEPLFLKYWAEGLLFLGVQQENLEQICQAKEKIEKCCERMPKFADCWYLLGSCLNELGDYFEDESYYLMAMEKLRYGLSLNDKHPLLLYGMALAHFSYGEKVDDLYHVDQALHFCSRAFDCGEELFPQFWNDWGIFLMKYGEMNQDPQFMLQALEKFERILKPYSDEMPLHRVQVEWVYNYGCAFDILGELSESEEYFEKAISIFLQLVELDPVNIRSRYSLALAYLHLAELVSSVEIYEKAIEHFEFLVEASHEDEAICIDYALALIGLGHLCVDDHQGVEDYYHYFQKAESLLFQAIGLGHLQANYHLAGLYALTGHESQALYYLEKAKYARALPPLEEILDDNWLEKIKDTPSFRKFLADVNEQESLEDPFF